MEKYDLKAILAKEAISMLPDSGIIGLGTGTTANTFIKALGEHSKGKNLSYQVVASSYESEQLAIRVGLDLIKQNIPDQLTITVDGADFFLEEENVFIKGKGGALLREKILKQAAAIYMILITENKLTTPLILPISLEILPFSFPFLEKKLEKFGLCSLRTNPSSNPILSNNGDWLVDLFLSKEQDWKTLHDQIKSIPGVLETGLFPIDSSQPTIIIIVNEEGIIHKKIFERS